MFFQARNPVGIKGEDCPTERRELYRVKEQAIWSTEVNKGNITNQHVVLSSYLFHKCVQRCKGLIKVAEHSF